MTKAICFLDFFMCAFVCKILYPTNKIQIILLQNSAICKYATSYINANRYPNNNFAKNIR